MIEKIKNDKAMRQLFYYIVLILIFLIENIFVAGKYNMHCKIDDMIPFMPVFVIPYFMWYFFIAVTCIYFLLKSKEDLRKVLLSINLCMLIAMIIYILFPNYQSLRPKVYGEDFFSQWVRLLQIGDSSSSVCPSLHVAVCINLYLGIISSSCFKNKLSLKVLTFFLTILICISTLFIKQHSIIDVAGGILLSAVVYVYVYIIKENIEAHMSCEETDNIGKSN